MKENQVRNTTLLQKVALLTGSTVFSIVLLLGIGNFIPYGNGTLTKSVIIKAWQLKLKVLGPPDIGIFEEDPVLGWKLKPSSSGKHFQPYGFNVKYHIDEQGHHITPGDYSLPKILFLGGSFTFGHGVEDHENYVWLLGELFPGLKMVNNAAMAWGSAHAWLVLQDAFKAYDDIKMVVYGYISYHPGRNYLRREWLDLVNSWGRRNPHFELENGKLVYKGLSEPGRDAIPLDDALIEKENAITLAFLQEMKELCAQKGVPFLVVHIPSGYTGSAEPDLSSVLDSSQYLDLRPVLSYENIRLDGDAHPSPSGHRQIADQVAPWIQRDIMTAGQ